MLATAAAQTQESRPGDFICTQTEKILGRPVVHHLAFDGGSSYTATVVSSTTSTYSTNLLKKHLPRTLLLRKEGTSHSQWDIPDGGGESLFKVVKFSPDGEIWLAAASRFDCVRR